MTIRDLEDDACLSLIVQTAMNTVLEEAGLVAEMAEGEYYGTMFLLWAIQEMPDTELSVSDLETRIANLLAPSHGKCHREFLEFAAFMCPTKLPQAIMRDVAAQPFARGRALNWVVLRLFVESLKFRHFRRLRWSIVAWVVRILTRWRRVEYGLIRDLPGGPSTQYTAFVYSLMGIFAFRFNSRVMQTAFLKHYGDLRTALLNTEIFSRVGRGANQMKAYVALFVCELFYSQIKGQPPNRRILHLVVGATVSLSDLENSRFRVTARNTNAAHSPGRAAGNHWSYNSDRDYAALCAALTLYSWNVYRVSVGK